MSLLNDTIRIPKSQEVFVTMASKKAASMMISNSFRRLNYDREAVLIRDCGDVLTFRRFEDGHRELDKASFCKNRLCPMCAWRRSRKAYGQLSMIMDKLDQIENRKVEYVFLTLTCRNVPGNELGLAIDSLSSAFYALAKINLVRKAFLGTYRSVEITYNREDDTFHPHIHVIAAVSQDYFTGPAYISHDLWVSIWRQCLSVNYLPSVDIRKLGGYDSQSRENGVAEAAKYACKLPLDVPLDLLDSLVLSLSVSLRSRRLTAYTGVLRKLHRELHLDDLDGDLVNDHSIRSDLAYILETYIWTASNGYFLAD